MKTLVVASKSPVKAHAALHGFQRMFPAEEFRVETVDAPSGVRPQPLSGEETLRGALNRAWGAAEQIPEADFWVGIEGGVEEQQGELAAFTWVVVLSGGRIGKGQTGIFFLPEAVADLVRRGVELGDAVDRVFGRTNLERMGGAVGVLTDHVIDRTRLYEEAVVLALVPFRNPDLYTAS